MENIQGKINSVKTEKRSKGAGGLRIIQIAEQPEKSQKPRRNNTNRDTWQTYEIKTKIGKEFEFINCKKCQKLTEIKCKTKDREKVFTSKAISNQIKSLRPYTGNMSSQRSIVTCKARHG